MNEDIFCEFPGCCQGIGKLKNCKLKLHIDESVKPVALPVRRIPYNLRDSSECALKNLLADDIIEPILPYKAKRVYLHKKLKIINFLVFIYSSTTFYSASDGVILF